MEKWLLDIYDVYTERLSDTGENQYGRLNPSLLPGLSYARALAMKAMEGGMTDDVNNQTLISLSDAIKTSSLGSFEEFCSSCSSNSRLPFCCTIVDR